MVERTKKPLLLTGIPRIESLDVKGLQNSATRKMEPKIYETAQLKENEAAEVENIIQLMDEEKKTKLSSARNQERKKLKAETKKMNKLIPYIPTDVIIDLKNLIYARTKTVSVKLKAEKKRLK